MKESVVRTGGSLMSRALASRVPACAHVLARVHGQARAASMRALSLLALACLANVSHAGEAVAPGEYIADGGLGQLSIAPVDGKGEGSGANQGAAFTLNAVGGNFHICDLEGRIVDGRATLESYSDEPACVVDFVPTQNGLEVNGTDACKQFCGARAWFAGTYLRPAPGCSNTEREATRAKFKRLYDGKRHAEALATLSPLTTRCARTLDRYEEGRIRNDIAITQYKLGQHAECLRTLAPYAEEAAESDETVLEGYAPSEGDTWLPILKAARFNLGLCSKQKR